MSDLTKKKIRLIYAALLSVMLIVTGVLLMVACVNVYKIGARPFTPENISAAFAKISVFVWITVGAVLVGAVLALILPEEKKKPLALRDKKETLARLLGRLNPDTADGELRAKMEAEKKLCRYLRIASVALCVIAAIPALVYVLDFRHFGADYDSSVVRACAWLLPCTFLSMGIFLTFSCFENASIERQIALAKAAMLESKNSTPLTTKEIYTDNRVIAMIRIAIAAAAVILMVAGILNGGMADVLSKAINICTECIGLG